MTVNTIIIVTLHTEGKCCFGKKIIALQIAGFVTHLPVYKLQYHGLV